MRHVDLFYANAAARIADEAQISHRSIVGDLDTGFTFVRLSTGWLQITGTVNGPAADLLVTATAAINNGATATLPSVAGQYHYITAIELVKLYGVVGIAAGAGVVITTTNLPGNPAFTTEQIASAAGTATKVISHNFKTPLKSSVLATATTFVAPAQLQTIWRWNITYYTGA